MEHLVKHVAKYGGSFQALDCHEKTALDIARDRKNIACFNMLAPHFRARCLPLHSSDARAERPNETVIVLDYVVKGGSELRRTQHYPKHEMTPASLLGVIKSMVKGLEPNSIVE